MTGFSYFDAARIYIYTFLLVFARALLLPLVVLVAAGTRVECVVVRRMLDTRND